MISSLLFVALLQGAASGAEPSRAVDVSLGVGLCGLPSSAMSSGVSFGAGLRGPRQTFSYFLRVDGQSRSGTNSAGANYSAFAIRPVLFGSLGHQYSSVTWIELMAGIGVAWNLSVGSQTAPLPAVTPEILAMMRFFLRANEQLMTRIFAEVDLGFVPTSLGFMTGGIRLGYEI